MTDTFLADFDADRARRRNQSVGRAQEAITLNSSTAPAQVSRAQRDAQLLGIPTAAVLGDPMFSAEAKAKRDSEYLAQAPAAARWLADDDNAAVAHDQVEQLSTLENLLAGVGSRALNLGAGLGRGILTAIDKPADYLQERFPTPLVGVENGRFTVRQGTAADAAAVGSVSVQNTIRRGEQATLGYVAGTSWEDVKRQPVQSIIPFALEQGIVSVPDMVAAVVNLPLYISARTGEIGQTRAENDGREDATVEDLVTALPVASASALLERFATRGLLGMGAPVRTIGQVPGAVARSTLREGTTEAIQEGIESAGETVGTQRGFSVAETADRALAGFVGGAPFGGAVRTVTAPVEVAVQRRQAAQAAEGQAAAFDEKRQAVLASPLRELVPERFRDYLRMASPPDAQVIVPGEAVVSFFQSNPDLDRWMDEWDIRDQVEQAAVAGTDVVFDQGTYLGSVVGTQADTAWARDLKFGDKAMSVNEAVEAEAEGEQELADVFARAVGEGESAQAVQSAYDRVQSDIKAKLRETGMGEQEARYAALLSADRYASRSEREGYADAWEAYQADGGVNFRQSLPPSVQAQKDRLDLVVAAMKSRDTGPTQRQLYGDSLLEFVSARGGIEDTGGDLASMDAAAWSNPRVAGRVGRRSIIRRPGSEPGAFGPDEVLTRAIEAGYFRDDASVNDLFEAVRGELAGQNRFSDSFARNNRTEETIKAADELADLLTQAGIDPQQASNEEIRAFVDGMGVEDASGVRASYDQQTPMTGPRGEIVFREDGATITFFKARDRSTFIHEMGHKWLDELIIDAARPAATEQTKADLQTVMDWFSKEAGETITAENFGVDQHELWARGWERYLMEGVSPSLELRAVFSRFADWIKRIYKNVANLNAPISNPVRDVMSRMIATDDQLASVREVQNLNRIFGDAQAGNMTKAEFEALTKADNDAWEASRERAYKSVMEPLRREATAAWKEERETLRDGQTEKVDSMPDVAALRLLEETGERLNRKALIDQAGTKGVLKLLPNRRPAIYSNDGVWHPDALAVEVGVANGDQLINALMEHEQERQNRRAQGDMRSVRDARIEDAMDAEMRFLNDDPLTDGRLETLANIAVHEKLKAKSLAMEATQLSKMAGRNALWTEEGIEAYARDTISNLRAVKINPSQYLRAERSAGLRAQRALLKKDYAKALDAKLVQVVNFQLYRSAIDAQEEVAKGEKLFSKVVRAKDQAASKSRNFDMVNAAREILAAYGLTRKSGQDASAYMAAVARYDPDAYAALKETIDTAVEVAAPLDQLSLQDFRELTEVIDQLWNLSRRTQVMEIEGRRVELQTARGEIVGDLTATRGARPGKRGLDKAVTQKERLMSDLLSIRSYLGKVEEWAMRQGPAFTKYIYRPVSQGADGYRTLLREHMPKLEAALKTLRPDIEKPFKIDAREIGYTFGHDGGNGVIEIIGAMRHMGNASNYRKLILGRGWGTKNPDGSLDDTAFQAMMSRLQAEGVIQKRHWDYVQAEWDLHDEIKPHVQRAHRRMTGRYFEEITSNAVETPFGIYKGGYVPAKVDPALDPRAAEFDLQGILANGTNGSFVWPGPANGFTKGRVEYNKPLDLDLRKAVSQFDEAMKYAMIGPAVQDVTRLLRDTEFAEVMNDYDQGVWNDFLQPWLVRAVSQRVTEPSDHPLMRRVEGAMSFVTRRTGAMIMFANVVNAAQQFTGFAPAMIRTGKVNMATALRDYVKNPAGMADKVAASSAFMANRLGSEMRDLSIEANRIKLAPGPYGRAAEWTERHAYFLQKGVQNMMDPIVWTAAYNRATERGEENPVAYADMVIRTTQDSYNAEDATKFATGSKFAAPFKMFSGYFIGQANLIATEVTIAAREKNYGRIAEIYTLGIFITAVGSEVIAQGLRGELGDEDDDGWWDDLADVFLISQLRYAAAFIPFVGQGVNALIGALDDKPYNDRLSLSPIVSTGEAVIRTVPNTINVIQGDADASRTVKDYSTVISLATGLPTFQRQTGYVADVLEGDVEPVGPVDAARGFISGRASEESRTD